MHKKLMRRSLAGLIVGALSVAGLATAAGPATADPGRTASRTITELVARSGGDFDDNNWDFDLLLNAVVAAGLADALDDPDVHLTLFAPRDSAFIKLAQDLGYGGSDEEGAFGHIVETLTAIGNGDPIPTLQAVLLYHVVDGRLPARLVLRADELTTLQGGTIELRGLQLRDNDPDFRNAVVLARKSNIRVKNGIVHSISRVMIPVDL